MYKLELVPYEVYDIMEDTVKLLMLKDVDDKWMPHFTIKTFSKDPLFEYDGKPLCDIYVGMRGFLSNKFEKINGGNSHTLSRLDGNGDLGIYTEIFDDHKYMRPYDNYKSHFREWKLNRLLDEDKTI